MAAKAPTKPAPVQEAAQTEPAGPLVLEELVEPLRALPEGERAFSAAALVDFADLMKRVKVGLLTRNPETEEIADQDRLLLTYLAAYFKGVCATPHIIHGDMLERPVVASGMVMPFAGPSETGGTARFGVPTNVTPDVLCDSVSELARMATAALLALFVYLNFKREATDLPSDEATLVFSTIAINSTANAANAERIDAEIEALAAPGGIRCAQIRWLMHFTRQLVMNQMGCVCHLLGNKERHAECVVAAQHDHRLMVKALPDVAMGYSLWARSAMGLQQSGVAAAVLTRGLDVATAARDDCWEASLAYQLAVARVLGGSPAAADSAAATAGAAGGGANGANGSAGGSKEEEADGAAPAAEFDSGEVLELKRRGDAAAAAVEVWWPAAWADQRPRGEPDRSVLVDKLLPMAAEKAGVAAVTEASGRLPALTGVLYVTRAPTSVPPGALDQMGVGAAVAEGEEEGSEGASDADARLPQPQV